MPTKLLAIVISIFLALAFAMFLFIDSFNGGLNEATGMIVSENSFSTYLETHPAITSLPKSSSVELAIGDKKYEINGQSVSKTDKDVGGDIKVTLPEGYETVIGELGLCDAIKKANKDKELSIDLYASKTFLLLKYRKLLKYGDCLN